MVDLGGVVKKVPEVVVVIVRVRSDLANEGPLQRAQADVAADQDEAEPHALWMTRTICIPECYQ